jgi:hypothetical protein
VAEGRARPGSLGSHRSIEGVARVARSGADADAAHAAADAQDDRGLETAVGVLILIYALSCVLAGLFAGVVAAWRYGSLLAQHERAQLSDSPIVQEIGQ